MNKKYIDSNIFLNSILYSDAKAKKCKEILYKIIQKEFVAVTSLLTWDEVVYIVEKNLGKNISIQEGEKFLRFPNLSFIDVNKQIIYRAQELASSYDIKPRDAIHAAAAIINNCNEIITDDSDFNSIKELKIIEPEKFRK